MDMKVLTVLALMGAFGLGVYAQGFLPELPYPGGYTFLRYEVRVPDKPPYSWVLEVLPKGDAYEVLVTFVREVSASEEFSLFGVFMGAGLLEEGMGMLPLAPLFSLWDKKIEVGRSYLLRERARLITEREDEVLGIPVVAGTYVHPSYPDQRAIVYIPRLPHRALLFFPPYLRVEEKDEGEYRLVEEIELVEFKHER
jgi:hypothetical protein